MKGETGIMETVCYKCTHCDKDRREGYRAICNLSRKLKRNHVKGEDEPVFQFCDEINRDGNCPDYQEGEPSFKGERQDESDTADN